MTDEEINKKIDRLQYVVAELSLRLAQLERIAGGYDYDSLPEPAPPELQ